MKRTEPYAVPVVGETGYTAPHGGHDPELPTDAIHASHRMTVVLARWTECARCGGRDYWAGVVRAACKGRAEGPARGEEAIHLGDAVARLREDVEAFEAHWTDHQDALGITRPSLDEWAGEFSEWRRGPR